MYGRVSAILPSIDQIRVPGDAEPQSPNIAHTHRLREVSVQAMIEGSAKARLGRALNTRTTMAGQKLNLQVGEEVDFYREPSQKDAPGWTGPAETIDVSRVTRGIVTVKWQNRVMEIQLRYLRRHPHFFSMLVSMEEDRGSGNAEAVSPSFSVAHRNVWACIRIAFEQLREGCLTQIGKVFHGGKWTDRPTTPGSPSSCTQ